MGAKEPERKTNLEEWKIAGIDELEGKEEVSARTHFCERDNMVIVLMLRALHVREVL